MHVLMSKPFKIGSILLMLGAVAAVLIVAVTSTQPDVTDEVAADAIREAISLHGMALRRLDVSSDIYSGQTLEVELAVPDVETANKAIPPFMKDLRKLPREVNNDLGTQIKIVKVDILDAQGEPLLEYVRDIELSRQRWQQSEELTAVWFPRPYFIDIEDEG